MSKHHEFLSKLAELMEEYAVEFSFFEHVDHYGELNGDKSFYIETGFRHDGSYAQSEIIDDR